MELVVEMKGWILLAVFLLLFNLERILPADTKRAAKTPHRLPKNAGLFVFSVGLSLLWVLPFGQWLQAYQPWQRPAWAQGGLGLGVDLLVLDLWIYWWHRANHEAPFLWRFHDVHHRDQNMDTTTALRFHFGEVFLSSFARAPVVLLLAVPFTHLVIFETLVLMAAFFHHSNLRLAPGLEKALSKVIITPSLHWVHHHALRADTDSTYGTIFSFWDRLFASQAQGHRTPGMVIGVEGRSDLNFLALLALPFRGPR